MVWLYDKCLCNSGAFITLAVFQWHLICLKAKILIPCIQQVFVTLDLETSHHALCGKVVMTSWWPLCHALADG